MNKQDFRNKIKIIRNNLSQEEVSTKSKKICSSLLKLLQSYDYENIFIYNSFKNEVSTKELIQNLYKKKNVFLPKVENDKMIAIQLKENTILQKNSFGIEEPFGSPTDINNFICIMPLLAVDEKGNRLGFGKGYYDKFLQDKQCIKIGLCYDFQIIKSIPCMEHDIPLDLIISEKRIIKIS